MKTEIERVIQEAYARVYPDWTGVRVSDTVEIPLGGKLAVVRAVEKNGSEIEPEICHLSDELEVTIFGSSEELARFMKATQSKSKWEKLFTRSGICGTTMLILLVVLCILAFFPGETNKTVVQLLGTAFVAAAGFYFGSTNK